MSLSEMISKEYGWMVSQAYRLCGNRMDAEDVAGEAVLRILTAGSYDRKRPFRPWCSVIIFNTYINRKSREGVVSYLPPCEVEGRSYSSASDRAVFSEALSAVRRCRNRSSAVDCVLMFAAGFSYDEIAEHFGIPKGTVRSRISYAREILRKELEYQ